MKKLFKKKKKKREFFPKNFFLNGYENLSGTILKKPVYPTL